ncbi:MAG TPA: hypothetical protein DCY20_01985 [Firmicutes bacterium]|nr:hypothetical protein [Bacillota bacterium]
MRKIFNKETVESYIQNCIYRNILEELPIELFLVQYEEGEFVSSPLQSEELFQIVVEGSLSIYFIRNDGTKYSLSSGKTDYIIGDMDFFRQPNNNIYAEASESLTCIALSINKNRDLLLNNTNFMRFIANSLSDKIGIITTLDAEPTSLRERVISYMKYKCDSGILKGMEQAAFHLHCSPRQLQRVMNDCEHDGLVNKIGKGSYQLTINEQQ